MDMRVSPRAKLKLVMVGNGMAGVRTIEELLKLAPDLYDITVFGAEPHPNYNRILLSPVLAGEQTLDEIVLNDWAWYADHGITLHAGKTVTEVDRVKRVVRAPDGQGEHQGHGLLMPAVERIGQPECVALPSGWYRKSRDILLSGDAGRRRVRLVESLERGADFDLARIEPAA